MSKRDCAADCLKRNRDTIISVWAERIADQVPCHIYQDKRALYDSLPMFLENLAEQLLAKDPLSLSVCLEISSLHGKERAQLAGYSLDQVLYEYITLRQVIFEVVRAHCDLTAFETDTIFESIQHGMREAGREFVEFQEQKARIDYETIKRQALELSGILEGFPEAIIVTDSHRIIRCNRLALNLLGFVSVEELNKNLLQLGDLIQERYLETGKEIPPEERCFSRSLRGKNCFREQIIKNRSTGKDIYVRLSSAPFFQEGLQAGVIIILTDITEIIQTQNERNILLNMSQMDIETLKEERKKRDYFITGLSHDLKNPLAAARTNAELILKYSTNIEAHSSCARRILKTLDRTDQMIQDLLDVSRIRAGKGLPLRIEYLDLSVVIREVLEELVLVYGNRFVLEKDSIVYGYWSPKDLRRAIDNLCSNAAKYGSSDTPITISVKKSEAQVEVSVHNWGGELSTEELERIFDQYHRTYSATKSKAIGWGIGLTLVRGISEAHGGKIEVKSNMGFGTTFTVVLPIDARPFQESGL